MITVKIDIGTIDYEKNFKELFPVAMKKLEMVENKNLALRFLMKMGEASMTAVLGILGRLDERAKGEILCGIIRLYGQEIVSRLNETLEKDEIGRNIHITQILLLQNGEEMELYAYGAKINYRGLLDNQDIQKKVKDAAENMVQGLGVGGLFQETIGNNVGILAKAAARIAPGEVERIGLNVLQKQNVKRQILALCEKAMRDKGVWLDLIDFSLEQTDPKQEIMAPIQEDAESVHLFSEELEEKILNAVVDYIKPLLTD